MADENFKRDGNRVTAIGGVTNDANLELVGLRVDPSTKRLLVSAVITAGGGGGGSGTEYTEGDVAAAIVGGAIMWEDTSDTLRAVSAAKPLPVNIVAGSSSGTEYTEDAVAPANPAGGALMAVRADSLAAITSDDGDVLALRATNKGEVYVKHADSVPVTGTFFQATQPVSAASLPLPSGASTGAKQDTGNTSLASIDGKITAVNTGAVVISSSALPSGAATGAKQDTGNTSVASIDTKTPALGQALAAASVPVVLTAAQLSTITPPAAITGFLTESDFDTKAGSLTETAPATDIASSGLNGRLQRIAQRITSLIALLPASLGQKAMTASLPVVLPSDQSSIPVAATLQANSGVDIGKLSANQSVNIAQMNGVTPLMGNGVTGTGSPRVTVASDNTPFPVKTDQTTHGTTDLVAADITKVAGTAIDTNSGNKSAGTQRVVLATDQPNLTTPLNVSLASVPSHAVTNAGTFATQVDGAALTALQLIDDPVFADDAGYTLSTHKAAVTGGVAVQTDGTDPTAVSNEGDAAALRTDMTRILLVNTTPPRLTSASENNATAQTNNPILSAPGASLSLYITDIVISNGATAGSIRFVEDTAGTPVIKVQETYMAINGGAVMSFKTPIRITANKDFGYTSTTVTTHSITVNGYIAP